MARNSSSACSKTSVRSCSVDKVVLDANVIVSASFGGVNADFLVTGDKDLLELTVQERATVGLSDVRILTPRAYLDFTG